MHPNPYPYRDLYPDMYVVPRQEEQQKFKMVDGVMMKEDEGKAKLDDLAKENPAMARFIEIGKFAHKELNALG